MPVLQIPPFKLPNINIDLSHINLGLDIKLPKFNFQPLKIDLPTLPDIPTPPVFNFNFNVDAITIPDIPVLPKPPVLHPLPSFLPEIKMQLPVLPPAPKIPKIPNEITEIIKVAKGISFSVPIDSMAGVLMYKFLTDTKSNRSIKNGK